MKRFSLILSAMFVVAFTGCSAASDGTTSPTPLACATNNTAQINFTNQSVTNRTYDVLIDGARVGSVSPGSTTGNYTVVAGVPHGIQFNVSNSSTAACTPAVATLIQCSTENYVCRG